MPTLEHNAIVEMFREKPELAPHVLATIFHRDVPSHASVRVADSRGPTSKDLVYIGRPGVSVALEREP